MADILSADPVSQQRLSHRLFPDSFERLHRLNQIRESASNETTDATTCRQPPAYRDLLAIQTTRPHELFHSYRYENTLHRTVTATSHALAWS